MTIKKGDILLDKYRIEKCRLGPGAYSNVYLATHLDLKVPRALKILRKGFDGGLGSQDFADYAERFRLEAQLGARLDHPNIVRVYDFEASTEQLVLVMEYCAGGSLAEVIELLRDKERLLPIKEVLQIAEQVASGLAELHKKQIVHRDLKPANILLDKNGTAKVADLGLAQVPGGPSMRGRLSSPIPHPGTPGYMSPEQKNSGDLLTPASDVYALGLVLFELLTGGIYAFQQPRTRPVNLRSDVPDWLDVLIMRMLSETAPERPINGKVLLGLLQDGIIKQKKEGTQQENEVRHKGRMSTHTENSSQTSYLEQRKPSQGEPSQLPVVSKEVVQPKRRDSTLEKSQVVVGKNIWQFKKIFPQFLLFLFTAFLSLNLISWGVYPPSAEGDPSVLRSDLKEEWVLLAADAYAYTSDVGWIQGVGLSSEEFKTILNDLVQRSPENASLSFLEEAADSIYLSSNVSGVRYIRTRTNWIVFLAALLMMVISLLVRKFSRKSPGFFLYLTIIFLAISVGIGLGYWVLPIQIVDLDVPSLSSEYQSIYLKMSVYSYALSQDEFLAIVRWQELGDAAQETLRLIENDPSLPLAALEKFKSFP